MEYNHENHSFTLDDGTNVTESGMWIDANCKGVLLLPKSGKTNAVCDMRQSFIPIHSEVMDSISTARLALAKIDVDMYDNTDAEVVEYLLKQTIDRLLPRVGRT